jgi:hypothetical protein
MEDPLRMTVHLIMSTPESQIVQRRQPSGGFYRNVAIQPK